MKNRNLLIGFLLTVNLFIFRDATIVNRSFHNLQQYIQTVEDDLKEGREPFDDLPTGIIFYRKPESEKNVIHYVIYRRVNLFFKKDYRAKIDGSVYLS